MDFFLLSSPVCVFFYFSVPDISPHFPRIKDPSRIIRSISHLAAARTHNKPNLRGDLWNLPGMCRQQRSCRSVVRQQVERQPSRTRNTSPWLPRRPAASPPELGLQIEAQIMWSNYPDRPDGIDRPSDRWVRVERSGVRDQILRFPFSRVRGCWFITGGGGVCGRVLLRRRVLIKIPPQGATQNPGARGKPGVRWPESAKEVGPI